jgi:capsular polysaccharide transport system permease protein
MPSSQDPAHHLAAVAKAVEDGDHAQASSLVEAWQDVPAPFALAALLLLDRRATLAGLLAAAQADREGLAAAVTALGLSPDQAVAGADALLAAAADPQGEAAQVHLASLLLLAGRCLLAEALLLPFWRGAATSAVVARALSGTWMLLRRDGEALDAARIAAEAAPGARDPLEHLAGLLLRAGRPAPALFAAGRAIGCAPDSHAGWRLASTALLELGETAEAIAVANRAARLSPLHAPHAEQVRTAHAADLAPAADPTPRAAEALRRTVPPGWAVPPQDLPRRGTGSLRAAISARLRVVEALVLRETRTMFSASRLGYAWALVEPLSHVLLLSAVFFFLGHDAQPPVGDTMLTFYMTGVLSFLFFAHMTERAMDLAASNRALLQLPAVGLFDILAGKAVLSATTDLVVAAITFAFLVLLGVGNVPDDPGAMIACYLVLFLFSCGIACVNLVVSAYGAAWEKLWPSFLRVQYFTCGVFYHPLDMPEDIRSLILLNPLVHVTEWMRQGYFHGYESPFLDILYLLQWTIGALLLGTAMFAASARQLRRHA